MKKLGRIVLLLLGAVFALACIILLGINMYVQSAGTHTRIQQELSQRIGATLRLQRVSVTPWGGLKLSGITIPQSDPAVSPDFLVAKTFRLRVQFWSLFSQPLVIKEVSLVNPTVVWSQNAHGEWRLPMTFEKAPSEDGHSATEGHALAASTPAAAASLPAAPSMPAEQKPAAIDPGAPDEQSQEDEGEIEPAGAAAFTPEVRRVNLSGGNFRFLDNRGKPVAAFNGVEFRSNFRTATAVRGNASIAKTSIRDRFFLEALQSPIHYSPTRLDLAQISAKAAGGDLSGRFTMQHQEAESPFTAMVKFRDVQADRVVSEAGGPAGVVQGKLEGHLEAVGRTADPNALSGSGEIFLRDGEVKQYSLLVALGRLLQIEELTQLHLDQAQVKYHINPGVVVVDELLLRSPNIRLSGKGTITFAGKIRLESQLALNDKIRGQLFQAIRDNFQPTAEPGFAAVDFQVSGTVEKPKTNLMDKVVGRDLKDLGGVINSLFGGKKQEKRKPKPEPADASPAPAAEAEPSLAPAAAPTPSSSPELSPVP